jgi:hypothetical protein
MEAVAAHNTVEKQRPAGLSVLDWSEARGRSANRRIPSHRRDACPAPLSQRCSGVLMPKIKAAAERPKGIAYLEKAFRCFGLDFKKNADWELLRAKVVSTKRGRPRGSKQWTAERHVALATELVLHMDSWDENVPVSELLNRIKANPNRYPSFHTLRKLAPTALDTFQIEADNLNKKLGRSENAGDGQFAQDFAVYSDKASRL